MKNFKVKSGNDEIYVYGDEICLDDYGLCVIMSRIVIARFQKWDYWYLIVEKKHENQSS